jgi:hypothetical protein
MICNLPEYIAIKKFLLQKSVTSLPCPLVVQESQPIAQSSLTLLIKTEVQI